MRFWLIGLLILGLAACDDSNTSPPAKLEQPPTTPAAAAPAQAIPDSAGDYHQLRQGWLELERESAAVPPSAEVSPVEPVKPTLPLPLPELTPRQRPAIGIIIDDVGHNLRQGQRVIALPAPVALAILPHTLAAERLAFAAQRAGKTVMLHQPMESMGGLSIGPGGLYAAMARDTFERTLNESLDSLLPVQGVNNHMGSRLTAQREAMDWTMATLRERDLFFIDSRTTADTQAAFAAEEAGVRHLSRDVFLDNERTTAAIDNAFQRALRLARKQGVALIIGHPYPQTLDYLEQRLVDVEQEEGVLVLSIEELLARKYATRQQPAAQ